MDKATNKQVKKAEIIKINGQSLVSVNAESYENCSITLIILWRSHVHQICHQNHNRTDLKLHTANR